MRRRGSRLEDELRKSASDALSRRTLDLLLDLNRDYSRGVNPPEIPETPELKLLKSIKTLARKLPADYIRNSSDAVARLLQLTSGHVLPTPRDFDLILTTPFARAYADLPHRQRSLSLSQPIATRTVSVSVVQRYFDAQGRLRLRLRLGVFVDEVGRSYWDMGVVDVAKVLSRINRLPATRERLHQPGRISAVMLMGGRQALVSLFQSQAPVSGIDYSPEYYHIEPLARRCGACPVDPEAWDQYRTRLEVSVKWTLDNAVERLRAQKRDLADLAIEQHRKGKVERIVVSLLLLNRLIIDPTTQHPFEWVVPRMVIPSPRSSEA